MKRSKKTDILLLKFKLQYRVIFLNKNFRKICDDHFDKKMGFAAFTIGLIQNQIGEKKTLKHLQINESEWLRLLSDIYDDTNIKNAYSELSLNPIISLENIEKYFDNFDVAINKIVQYINVEHLNLKINENNLKYILKSAFGYILYNCLDCRIPYELKDIILDKDYDQKIIMITNNTKLFAKAKNAILNNCGQQVSDLVSLLIGISNELNFDRKLIE